MGDRERCRVAMRAAKPVSCSCFCPLKRSAVGQSFVGESPAATVMEDSPIGGDRRWLLNHVE